MKQLPLTKALKDPTTERRDSRGIPKRRTLNIQRRTPNLEADCNFSPRGFLLPSIFASAPSVSSVVSMLHQIRLDEIWTRMNVPPSLKLRRGRRSTDCLNESW